MPARTSWRPASPHDAHRPLLPGELLDDVFRLQLERKLSRNLTLHYWRVLYVLEPTAEAQRMKVKRAKVYEDDDGNLSIRAGDTELPARAFAKESARHAPDESSARFERSEPIGSAVRASTK